MDNAHMVINPNTSENMTDHVRRELERIRRPDTELTVTNPGLGLVSIESAYDKALAIPPTVELVRQANEDATMPPSWPVSRIPG